ncbi:xaa-Pro aminopeptidase 3-like isoform X1 [Anopheles bellator]|uniref:xaa-Pro aminopeptidase 3-like isoform X1 n=2 Tax=Anopheles bellator TaxID=139047 RepID=UPI0026475C29|nr:xaa-Pro aminopeptidase 3-like isoform X1 [Anopheles bellator]
MTHLRKLLFLRNLSSMPCLKYFTLPAGCSLRACSSRSQQCIPSLNRKTNDHSRQNALYGQPVALTHPHIIKAGEVLPGIQLEEVKLRRHALIQAIRAYCAVNIDKNIKNHIIIIPAANKKYMSDKIPYVFRQNSDFLYLSGCQEPESVLVMEIDSSTKHKTTIFLRPKDKHAEMWDGSRTGVELAPDVFGVEQAMDIGELMDYLCRYSFAYPNALVWYGKNCSNLSNVSHVIKDMFNCEPRSPTELIHQLRVIKSASEINLMRKSCEIASQAINRTMKQSFPGINEHHIFASVDYYARLGGANFLAYPPVVAGGTNATTIHYINNNQIIENGELVLLDAGCEYHGYTSDITRTWPVNGTFSEPQRVLYEVLQLVQSELLSCLLSTEGETLDRLFDTMCTKIGKYLQEIKLIPGSLSGVELSRAAYKFCPHHASHYLGMDVHDTPLISRNIQLKPGMVCTVEPGIYIAKDRTDVPAEFKGLGLRIEDDVLIKSCNEIEVLTAQCVKDRILLENILSNTDTQEKV